MVLIADGAAGWPVDEFGGSTSLAAAKMPHMARIAREGRVGLAHTVPPGMEASSAVACMSVLGYDPARYYGGRGPIEALALGIDLEPGEAALRCNLVTVETGTMRSYAAGAIPSAESHELIAALQADLGDERVRFHPGVGFRHILTVRDGADVVHTMCSAPHDITDQPIAPSLPRGPGASLLVDLMERSRDILARHPVNLARVERGCLPATQIWPFWPGLRPAAMPSFAECFGVRAAISSPVDLLRGLARQMSVEVLEIPGVTDGPDNDYEGQMRGSLEALDRCDLVVVHVEAPDETGHRGDAEGKRLALERIDSMMVPLVLERSDEVRLLVMPDHPTPIALRTHTDEPVPFVLFGPGFVSNGASAFTEAEAAGTGLVMPAAHELMRRLLDRSARESGATGEVD